MSPISLSALDKQIARKRQHILRVLLRRPIPPGDTKSGLAPLPSPSADPVQSMPLRPAEPRGGAGS
jgi:hypothetical protein